MERKCKNCANFTWGDLKGPITDVCIQCKYVGVNGRPQPSNWKPHHMTNAERIRAMTDQELADFLCGVYDDENCSVYQCESGKFINGTIILDYDEFKILDWLQQPAEVE